MLQQIGQLFMLGFRGAKIAPWLTDFACNYASGKGMQKRFGTKVACALALRAGVDLLCIGNNLIDEQEACDGYARSSIKATQSIQPMRHLKES